MIDGVDVREQDLDGDGIISQKILSYWLKVCALHATESDSFVVDAGAGNVQRVDQACTTESGLDLTQLVQNSFMEL